MKSPLSTHLRHMGSNVQTSQVLRPLRAAAVVTLGGFRGRTCIIPPNVSIGKSSCETTDTTGVRDFLRRTYISLAWLLRLAQCATCPTVTPSPNRVAISLLVRPLERSSFILVRRWVRSARCLGIHPSLSDVIDMLIQPITEVCHLIEGQRD